MKALPTHGLQPIKCGSHSLDAPQVTAIERLVAEQLKDVTKTIKMKVKPWLLYKVCVCSAMWRIHVHLSKCSSANYTVN